MRELACNGNSPAYRGGKSSALKINPFEKTNISDQYRDENRPDMFTKTKKAPTLL